MPRLPPFDTNEPDSCSEGIVDRNAIDYNPILSQLPLLVSSEVEQAREQFNEPEPTEKPVSKQESSSKDMVVSNSIDMNLILPHPNDTELNTKNSSEPDSTSEDVIVEDFSNLNSIFPQLTPP